MASQKLTFKLTELRVGFRLQYDLTRIDGTPLAQVGEIVTSQVLAAWTKAGIDTAIAIIPSDTAHGTQSAEMESASESSSVISSGDDFALIQLYDEQALQRIEVCFSKAADATLKAVDLLASDELEDCQEIAAAIEDFMVEVDLDIGTVLASMSGGKVEPVGSNDTQLAKRCARMAMMAMVVSKTMGSSQAECQMVGLVGLVHDLSLFDRTQTAVQRIYGAQSETEHRYHDHPLQSASLLTYAKRVSAQIRHIVSQVHEEANGRGFPRGLSQHRIHPMARVLNLVDAYLTLTDSDPPDRLPPGLKMLPADAMAYLMHHARQGHFDVNAMKGFVNATSLYPVGSLVELSDESIAVVLRSTKSSPFEPIVRLDQGEGPVVDIRHSALSVIRPVGMRGKQHERISTSKLNSIFWR